MTQDDERSGQDDETLDEEPYSPTGPETEDDEPSEEPYEPQAPEDAQKGSVDLGRGK